MIEEEEGDVIVIDDDFLSLIEEAEAKASSLKRRKIITNGGGGGGEKEGSISKKIVVEEGAYTAALKGNLDSFNTKTKGTGNFIGDRLSSSTHLEGGSSGNACFKCGQLGHWARDCTAIGTGVERKVATGGGVVEKSCPCGVGTCLILTANTEKNPGRKFYKCPVREENGGCGFFEWCDNSSADPVASRVQNSASTTSFPDLPCPCGAGSCLVLTAKTGQNFGQQFYRCPANQGSSCGFFKWCNQHNLAVGQRTSNFDNPNNKIINGTAGGSCYKCGQDGHWAKDCHAQTSLPSSFDIGRNSSSSGTSYSNLNNSNNKNYSGTSGSCYKCGLDGHWAKECPGKPSLTPSVGMGLNSSSSTSCYKCGKSGHWAKDCSGQDLKSCKKSNKNASALYNYHR